MVLKFPVYRFCVILGLICCIYPFVCNLTSSHYDTNTYTSPLNILIIDPGHGGVDGGAVGIDGTIESSVNLDIARKLNMLCHLYGITTLMTRQNETIDYPSDADTIAEKKVADQNARLRLIRDYPHAILYSIHQNYYPSPSVSGFHIFYGHSSESKQLGDILQRNYEQACTPQTRRVPSEISDDIYLMKHCECTSVLIECGFLSNRSECTLLNSESYRLKLSTIMLSSYLEYMNYRNETEL